MALIGGTTGTSTIAAGSRSETAKAKNDEDLNKFLNLLVTQLKNQDPLDPMDATEFTAQLVQFAGVEQQIFANANMEKLVALGETNQISSMVNFIGKTVEAEGRTMPLENSKATFSYTMPSGANKASYTITNASGLTVFKGDADTSVGKHTFTWDGISTSGGLQSDGDYNVLVSGTDFQGNLLEITHTIQGRVKGAGILEGASNLFLGDNIIIGQDKLLSVKETKAPVI